MEKKDKVKEVNNLNKQDNYGNHTFIVKMMNGDQGFFSTKNPTASQFKVGEEVTYVFEEKPKKDGSGTYTKISLPKKEFIPGGKGGYQQMTISEYIERQKVDSVGYALSYAKDLVVSKDLKIDQMQEYAKKFLDWTNMHMDKLNIKK